MHLNVKETENYNKRAGAETSRLLPGMKVSFEKYEKSSTWYPGTVKAVCKEPQSYIISTPNGSDIRRNRRFLQEISPEACKKLGFSPRKQVTFADEVNGKQNTDNTISASTGKKPML